MTPATPWPEARATRGLVATPHALASEAGVAVLQRGGNALDAAIAAAATIAVVYPHMNGIGGDNVWLIYDAARGAPARPQRRGRAAAAADLEGYRARFGAAIPVRAVEPPRSRCRAPCRAGGRRTSTAATSWARR